MWPFSSSNETPDSKKCRTIFAVVVVLLMGTFLILGAAYYLKMKPTEREFERPYGHPDDSLDVPEIDKLMKGKLRLPQDNPRLVQFVIEEYLVPPKAGGRAGDAFKEKHKKSLRINPITAYIMNLHFNKTKGVFVEAEAFDGVFASNTIPLEVLLDWTGLLVESETFPSINLVRSGRNAWTIGTCLSTEKYPLRRRLQKNSKYNPHQKRDEDANNHGPDLSYEAACLPLYTILQAIKMRTIDYLSLDIEGGIVEVLRTIPWKELLIKSVSVKVNPKTSQAVHTMMTHEAGFKFLTTIPDPDLADFEYKIYADPRVLYKLNLH